MNFNIAEIKIIIGDEYENKLRGKLIHILFSNFFCQCLKKGKCEF